jgi:hypothetical protein
VAANKPPGERSRFREGNDGKKPSSVASPVAQEMADARASGTAVRSSPFDERLDP